MSKKIISIIFIILLINLFEGCTKKTTDNENFIGSWNGRYETEGLKDELETEATFYENNTLKTVYYQLNNNSRTMAYTDWVIYTIEENGTIYYKDIKTNKIVSHLNYTFSDNYSKLTFTIESEPDFKYVLTKISG